jgi:hypothetical protein
MQVAVGHVDDVPEIAATLERQTLAWSSPKS